jgi:hypothetical protein
MKRRGNIPSLRIITVFLSALALLFLCGAASAEEPHTVVVSCGGGGFVGILGSQPYGVTLAPDTRVAAADGTEWTLDALLREPGFRLEGATLRFTVTEVEGANLLYTLFCGNRFSMPQRVLEGCNLWDVSVPFTAWMDSPDEPLSLKPMHGLSEVGFRVREGSVSLQLTFRTSSKLPLFPLDRVRDRPFYEAALSMLEQGNPFIGYYDDTADSLITASLPLGVPYYYAGRTEEKFLNRYYPETITNYYRPDRMYFCGLDCVGMTRLIYEKSDMERHPSIIAMLARGIGSSALKSRDPAEWPSLLLPGELFCVRHGTYHVMMYLGTLRQFGWTEADAGEAAPLLDEPLVIHCGGNPFYYDRYLGLIREKGYRNTYPPDGGVTVSVIRQTNKDAPHTMTAKWGKFFGWYLLGDYPLLVFPLDDCTDMAWFGVSQ